MRTAIFALLAMVGTVSQASVASRTTRPPASATDVTSAEILTVLTLAKLDQQIKVVDIGQYNVAVGILHRGARPAAARAGRVSAYSHDQVTEVYYIVSGSGTLVTGGTMADATPDDLGELVGPSLGGFVEGGHSRTVTSGDVIIIPPGVPHGFSAIDEHIDYLSIRVDADHVLPAGYVHQAIKGSAHQEQQP